MSRLGHIKAHSSPGSLIPLHSRPDPRPANIMRSLVLVLALLSLSLAAVPASVMLEVRGEYFADPNGDEKRWSF